MKHFVLGVVVLLVVVTGYVASAYVGLYRLVAAVEARDVAAMSERVDFPRLRQSFGAQVIETHLKVTGRRLGRFGAVIVGAGASLAEPIVAQIMSADRLIDLLQTGDLPVATQPPAASSGPLSITVRTDSLWSAIRNSSFGFGNFYISLPAKAPRHDQFVLHFKLTQWRWKLTTIALPERLRVRLAHELEKIIN